MQYGYGSNGQFCLECAKGVTCDRHGDVACKGQCQAGILSECDDNLGYAVCQKSCPGQSLLVANATVVRGTNIRADCDTSPYTYPYFECLPGFYKLYQAQGVVVCQPCGSVTFNRPAYSVWITPGLSPNDEGSCVWECDRTSSVMYPNGTGCMLLPLTQRLGWVAKNAPGYYTLPNLATCQPGYTSERALAGFASDCVRCPDPPVNGLIMSASLTCGWYCESGVQRGSICVLRQACRQGFSLESSGSSACRPTPLPWQPSGSYKTGVTVMPTGVSGSIQVAPEFRAFSRGYGIYGRHYVVSDSGGVNWTVPGPVCSVCSSWIGSSRFLFLTICNQSFVGYMNLSGGAVFHILIGNSTGGWQDGFRTDALFQNELYVTNGPENKTLFVLDRWNCLLREIVITVPGDYLTRVYTLYGLTSKFAITGEPRCYGGGSLLAPRRFYYGAGNADRSRIFFGDENGIWEIYSELRSVILAVSGKLIQGWNPERLQGLDVASHFVLNLWYQGFLINITALSSICPSGKTSLDGGDCSISCTLQDERGNGVNYVDPATGLCLPCQNPACGLGQYLVPCSPSGQGSCQPCQQDQTNQSVYVIPNTCDPAYMRPAPPCKAGWYLAPAPPHCERCPAYSATLFANSTGVQQCKCWTGFRRIAGQCTAAGLYSYSQNVVCPLLGQDSCNIPQNASFTGQTGCDWACDVGFYRSSVVGFLEQCRPCLGLPLGGTFITRGDDDSPLSCEFGGQ